MRYENLTQYPAIFEAVTGLCITEFDQVTRTVQPVWEAAERQRLYREARLRAPGGGEPSHLEGRDQVLLAMIWLWLYPTHDALGDLFGVSQPTVGRYLKRMVPALAQVGWNTGRRTDPGKLRRKSLAQILGDLPEIMRIVAVERV